jgi:hypothetical protein
MAEGMQLATLSGEQLTAGTKLMGKSFEDVELMAKRGLNNANDSIKAMDDEQLKAFASMNKNINEFKSAFTQAFREIVMAGMEFFQWLDSIMPQALKAKGDLVFGRTDEQIKAAKDLQKLFDERTKKRDAANRTEREATFKKEKKVHDEKVKMIETDLTAAQKIGGYVAASSINTVQNMALYEAQHQTILLKNIHQELIISNKKPTTRPVDPMLTAVLSGFR